MNTELQQGSIAQQIIDAIQKVVGPGPVALHEPEFSGNEWVYFNGNKMIITGDGGAIITDDGQLAKRAKHTTMPAKLPHGWRYEYDEAGYDYRMPNLNAPLGCAQLENLPDFFKRKRLLSRRYQEAFDKIDGVELFSEPEDCRSNFWLQTLVLSKDAASWQCELLQTTNDFELMTRPIWTPLHKPQPYESCSWMDLMTTECQAARVINIPSSSRLARQRSTTSPKTG